MSYEVIKDYYKKGLFNDDDLIVFIDCGWITEEEYNDIINS